MEFAERIARAKCGDSSVVDKLLFDWRPWLRAQARGIVQGAPRARADSSDIVQVTMAEAYQNVGQFRGTSSGEWAAWLLQIMQGQALQLYRYHHAARRNKRREVAASWAMVEFQPSPSRLAVERERAEQLREALDTLPDALRDIIERRVFQEQPFTVIGRELGCSERTVRRNWTIALRSLAETLEEMTKNRDSCDGLASRAET